MNEKTFLKIQIVVWFWVAVMIALSAEAFIIENILDLIIRLSLMIASVFMSLGNLRLYESKE